MIDFICNCELIVLFCNQLEAGRNLHSLESGDCWLYWDRDDMLPQSKPQARSLSSYVSNPQSPKLTSPLLSPPPPSSSVRRTAWYPRRWVSRLAGLLDYFPCDKSLHWCLLLFCSPSLCWANNSTDCFLTSSCIYDSRKAPAWGRLVLGGGPACDEVHVVGVLTITLLLSALNTQTQLEAPCFQVRDVTGCCRLLAQG